MFCSKCGKELPDNSRFCTGCGAKVNTDPVQVPPDSLKQEPKPDNTNANIDSSSTESGTHAIEDVKSDKNETHKKKNRLLLIGGIIVIVLALFLIANFVFSAKNNASRKKAIETVRTGYLGEYTDVTIDDIATYILQSVDSSAKITWDGGLTDDGVMIVEASSVDSDGQTMQLQFRMIDDETFRFGAVTGVDNLNDAVKYLNTVYYLYYIEPLDPSDNDAYNAVADKMNQFSCGAVLCGASAKYTGDRENLYQSAFNIDPLPATAANYIGLLDGQITGEVEYTDDTDISGSWQDTWSQRCTMDITSEGDSYYSFDIIWSQSASEYDEWTFSGYYDSETESLQYYDGMWYTRGEYDYENGVSGDTINLDSMEGTVWLHDGRLYWNDFTSVENDWDFGSSNMCFEKIN